MQRTEEESAIKKAREVNVALTNDLRELKRQQQALAEEIDRLKATKNEQTDRLVSGGNMIVRRGGKLVSLRKAYGISFSFSFFLL